MSATLTIDNYALVGAIETAVYGRPMRWVSYQPAEPPWVVQAYQEAKSRVRAHPWLSAVVAGGGVGAAILALPPVRAALQRHAGWASLSAAAGATLLTYLDRQLDPRPEDQMRRTFRGIEDVWIQAYQAHFKPDGDRTTLDRFVRLARNPTLLLDDIKVADNPEDLAKKLGVVASLAADLVHAWSRRQSLRETDPAALVRAVFSEKAWQPADEEALEQVRASRSQADLVAMLRSGQSIAAGPAFERLDDLLRRPDLQLRVFLPPDFPLPHFGTQLSRGSIRVTGVPGNSAFSYIGFHDPAGLPYVFLQDGAGAFCASNQRRGLVVANGPAGREASKDQKGGVSVYLSSLGDSAFERMNGPAVGVVYRPADPERLGRPKNGWIVLLEQGPSSRAPQARRYENGACVETLEVRDLDTVVRLVKGAQEAAAAGAGRG